MAGLSAGVAYIDVKPQLDALQRNLTSQIKTSVERSESNLAGRFGAMGKSFGKQLLGGIGITFAAAGIVKFLGSSVDEAKRAEESQLQLNQAFKTFPLLANTSIKELREYNSQLALKTKFDDDAFASGQAVLAQFKLSGKQIKEITPLLADYAARTGMDLPAAATALGRAFLGNTRALKTIGINFKATGNTTKDYASIIGLLNQKVGGFATEEGKTFSGRLEIMHTQFNELKESIGRAVLPILGKLADFAVGTLIPGLQRFGGILKDTFGPIFSQIISSVKGFIPVLASIGEPIAKALLPVIKDLGRFFVSTIVPVFNAVAGVARVLIKAIVDLAGRLAGPLRSAVHSITQAFADHRQQIESVINFVKGLISVIVKVLVPVLSVVLGTALRVAGAAIGIVISAASSLIGAFGHVKNAVADAIGFLKSVFISGLKLLIDAFLGFVSVLLHGAAAAFGWIPGIGGKLKHARDAFDAFKDRVDADLAAIAKGAVYTATKLDGVLSSFSSLPKAIQIDLIGGGSTQFRSGKFLKFAEGGSVPGPVNQPRFAVVHGGEFVLSRAMLKDLASVKRGGDGAASGDTIIINNPKPEAAEESLAYVLRRRALMRGH